MDPLELEYDALETVPEAFRSLYTENNGKFVLTGINGIKTQGDVDRVMGSLTKERNDHNLVKVSLKAWGDLKPDTVRAELDRIEEYKVAAAGKLDDEGINKIVTSRLNQQIAPLNRSLEELGANFALSQEENKTLKSTMNSRDRNDVIRGIAAEMKAHGTAMPDIEMAASLMLEKAENGQWIAKDGISNITPGLDIRGWLKEMQKQRPHWWPESAGGGAGGGGSGTFTGVNPFTTEGWNITQQMAIVRDKGTEIADRMARAAGTTVGGAKPRPKT